MPQWYFNCSGPGFDFPDELGEWLPDIDAAHDAAVRLAQALASHLDRDWQDWSFHVADEEGQTRLIYLVSDAVTPSPSTDIDWLI